jgi:hypothetical protein
MSRTASVATTLDGYVTGLSQGPEHTEPDQNTIAAAASWSVEYAGIPYDDARRVGGVWFHWNFLTNGVYRRFAFQNRVVPLSRNESVG